MQTISSKNHPYAAPAQSIPETPAVWLPAIKARTGVDIFTQQLADGLLSMGIRAEVFWLPKYAEYCPFLTQQITPPLWANIVHINSWLPARFIPKQIPSVVTSHLCIHDPVANEFKSTTQKLYHNKWIRRCELNAFSTASAITAVSDYTARITDDIFDLNKPVHTIYNWVDTEIFYPENINQRPHRPFRLLFSGKLSKRKGADILPRLMENLGDGFSLYVTGTIKEFRKFSQRLNNIIFLDNVRPSEMNSLYNSCDALIFPTRLEGFGLSVIEAQRCGLPAITSRSSSMPEVTPKNSNLCFDINDIQSFTNIIRKLATDEDFYKDKSHSALAHSTLFSKTIALENYIQLYKNVLTTRDN